MISVAKLTAHDVIPWNLNITFFAVIFGCYWCCKMQLDDTNTEWIEPSFLLTFGLDMAFHSRVWVENILDMVMDRDRDIDSFAENCNDLHEDWNQDCQVLSLCRSLRWLFDVASGDLGNFCWAKAHALLFQLVKILLFLK